VDMGVEEYLLANTLAGVVAQRLVKKICTFCQEEYLPTERERRVLGADCPDMLMRGKGCHNCNSTGYKGRVAIHEILAIDEDIRNLISAKAATKEIYDHVKEHGKLKFLRDSLHELVLAKRTTVDELLKLTYST